MITLDRRHWIFGLSAAAILHVGLAIAVFWEVANSGAQAPGLGGIEIALGPGGSAAGGDKAVPEPQELVEEQQDAPVEDLPEPVVEEEPPPPQPEELVPAIREEPPRPRQPPPPEPEASTLGGEGRVGTSAGINAGTNPQDTAAGGSPGARADYASTILAWLERHKEYPRLSQMRREQGVVMLYLVIDRDGNVLDSRIQESSGYRSLDREALEMVKRASPLPPMPDDMPQERLEIIVPVQFFLT